MAPPIGRKTEKPWGLCTHGLRCESQRNYHSKDAHPLEHLDSVLLIILATSTSGMYDLTKVYPLLVNCQLNVDSDPISYCSDRPA